MDYRAQLANLNTAWKAKWEDLLERPEAGLSNLFTMTESTEGGSTVDLSFMGPTPEVKEFAGEKEFDAVRMYSFSATVTMKTANLEMNGLDIRTDKGGVIGRMLDRFARKAIGFRDKLVTESLVSASGEGPDGYDGVNVINDSHPHGPAAGTQDNKTTDALTIGSYEAGHIAMGEFRNENGEPLHRTPTHLMVGPKKKKAALEITQSKDRVAAISVAGVEATASVTSAASIENVFTTYGGGSCDVIVNPRLVSTQDDYWYLMDLSNPSELPMLWVESRAPTLVPNVDLDSGPRFSRDAYQWSIEMDAKVTAGVWHSIYAGIL